MRIDPNACCRCQARIGREFWKLTVDCNIRDGLQLIFLCTKCGEDALVTVKGWLEQGRPKPETT